MWASAARQRQGDLISVVCESSDSRGLRAGAQFLVNTSGKELVRSRSAARCARYADGRLQELAATKGWWCGGESCGYENLRGHGGARVYRVENRRKGLAAARGQPDRSAMCGGQSADGCDTCVRMWVQGLGRGQADAIGAAAWGRACCHGTSACVGVVGVSVAGVLWCVQMSESCGEDFVQGSVHSVGQELRRHRRRGRWLSVSMWWPGLLSNVTMRRWMMQR